MRIVSWNIRSGGGRRVAEIADQITRWQPDIVALSEFRGTPPSQALAGALATQGLTFQLTTVDAAHPASNALLLASRHPLERLDTPTVATTPIRWLLARIATPVPITLGVMHAPNYVTGYKGGFLNDVLAIARGWSLGPGMLIGDTNSGWCGVDEETRAFTRLEHDWMDALHDHGWVDVFRQRHGQERAYTWYSPNGGNGFRIDQAFANPTLHPMIRAIRYVWGQQGLEPERRDSLSDHAAIVLDVELL